MPGSGKTYLTKVILEALDLQPHEYMVGAFTGKASYKLQQTGFPQAKTLHKLRYKSIKVQDNFIHVPLPKEEFNHIKLILIDEVSMVPDNMMRDLLNLGVHLLLLGDPGQLPPVGKDNGMLNNPQIFLDEIVRQAEGNSIIRLAHSIRNNELVVPFSDEFIQMIPKAELSTGMLSWADQILCAKNDTRNQINRWMREEYGFDGVFPQKGEKIIVVENNWDLFSKQGNSAINGMVGEITWSAGRFAPEDDSMSRATGEPVKTSYLDFCPEFEMGIKNSGFSHFKYDVLPFIDGTKSAILNYKANKGMNKINLIDFGYAITVHKAQGSEYGKVLGIDERSQGINYRKWLYTLVTRASDKLVLMYDDTIKSSDPMWKT